MAKGYDEIAADILNEIIRAKAALIAEIGNYDVKQELTEKYLSDDVLVESYKKLYAVVANPLK